MVVYVAMEASHIMLCVVSLQNIILDEGEHYAGLLYSWRSLSRAVPAVSTLLAAKLTRDTLVANSIAAVVRSKADM